MKKKIKSDNQFPVVGIGASAGGLQAFKRLLKAIPENSGMAYVLVQHLDPNHESMLPEILQKATKIPVLEISDDIKVEPNHIYVIPSNKMLVANDGILELTPRITNKNERNLPIDLFFTSLAEIHQAHAIGVVLSGTGSDGTAGLRAIKNYGGLTFAQDEESAEYEGMPLSAANAGVVDFKLTPEEIPQKILDVTSKIIISDENLQNIPQEDENIFKQILSLLRIRKGVDFTYYKQTTIRRRILRRMVVNKNDEPSEYLKYLRENKTEQDLLYQDLLIPVTSFFRDKKVFDNICENVFPAILKNKVPGDTTRIWVAGCSTGQEVYSFAMCFKDFLGDNHERIQIFGTDLSEIAIAKARTGIYDKSEFDAVSPRHLKDYFTKINGSYQVNKNLRDMCVFSHHNFLKDPPFGKMDCISCRNVLIYMEPYLQKKALTTFHYALNANGFLLLGKSETTGGIPDLFAAVPKTDKLYTRKDAPGRFMQVASQRSEQILNQPNENFKNEYPRNDFQKTADDILLSKYTPAGAVVNENMDIVHFRGNTGNYLEQAPGKPTHNLLQMAKNGLAFELRNILHKVKKEKIPVIKENIPVVVNGHLRNTTIEAIPLPHTLEPYYLILFSDYNFNETDTAIPGNNKKITGKAKKDEKDARIQLLELELSQLREDMRSITEDQEASNEELQSANEELLSGSEELQSLNEELETSKEELQSTNEELTVLNHELIGLNEQVTDAKNYSESIVATLYQPLLVLDKHLRVKTANQAFYKTFKVHEEETEGVLIYDLGNRQWNIPELRTLLEEILPQKKQITDYEVTHNFLSIGERIILLSALEITREKKEEKLILLSIEDITERKKAVKKIEENEKHLQNIFLNAPAAICILEGTEQKVILANQAYEKLINRKAPDLLGKGNREVFPELTGTGTFELFDKVFETGEPFTAPEYAAMVDLKNDGVLRQCYFNFSVDPLKNDLGKIYAVMVMSYDITEQVEARKKIEESEKKFEAAILAVEGIIWTNNANGEMTGEQLGWADLTGQRFEEYQDYGWVKAIHPDDVKPTVEAWNNAVANQSIFEHEHRVNTKQHGWKLFSIKAVPVFYKNGTVQQWVGVHTDISEQREAAKKIEENEKQLQNIFLNAPAAISILEGTEHIFVLANTAYEKLTTRKTEDLLGKSASEVFPELIGTGALELHDNVFETGESFSAPEYAIMLDLKNDGVLQQCYFNFFMEPLRNDSGEIYAVMSMAYDITEQVEGRKKIAESEERQAYLLKLSDGLRALTGPLDIQRAACQLLGEQMQVTRVVYGDVVEEQKVIISNNYVNGVAPIIATLNAEEFGLDLIATYKQNEKLIVSDVHTDPRFTSAERQNFASLEIVANASLGLLKGGRLVATFGMHQNAPREWTATDILLMEETAERIWAALERAKALKALGKSEAKYRSLFNSIDQGFAYSELIRNKEGKAIDYCVLDVNRSYEKQTGVSMETVLGKTILQVFPTLDTWWIKTYAAVVDNQRPIVFEKYFENNHRWYEVNAYPGEKDRFAVLFNDITERKQAEDKLKESENRFRTMADASPVLIWTLDAKGFSTYCNKTFLDFLGVSEDAEISDWALIVHPDDVQFTSDTINAAIAERRSYSLELRLLRADGQWRWVMAQGNANIGANNKFLGFVGSSVDITERKQAEQNIAESDKRYNMLVMQSPFAFAVLKGKDMVITLCNDSMKEMWGKGKQIEGKPLLEVLPEIKDQPYPALLDQVYTTGIPFYDNESLAKLVRNGKMEDVYFNFVYQPYREADETISGVAIIATEVTPQAISNKKIKASEEKFKLLVLQAPIAICVMRGENYVIEVINKGMCEMWNRSLKDVLNKPAFDVLPELLDKGIKDLFDNVYKTGERFVADELPVNLNRNGKIKDIFIKLVSEPITDADGTISGVMCLVLEITDQVKAKKRIEESEKQFRQMAELMPQKVWTADAEGHKNYFNQTLIDYCGLTFEDLKGGGWEKIIHPEDWARDKELWQESLKTGKKYEVENRLLRKDGKYIWHLSMAVAIKDQNDNIKMWVGSKTEIQEQKEINNELEKAVLKRTNELQEVNKKLLFQNIEKEKRAAELFIANDKLAFESEEKEKRSTELNLANIELAYQNEEKEKRSLALINVNKELEAFTYVSSHDLQEPLRKIQTFAIRILEMEDQNLSDLGKDYLKRMQSSSKRMQQLIEDLLAFSRLSKADRKFKNTDLNIIINEVKKDLIENIEEKHAIIEVAKLCHAKIIPFQFRQLMQNLIGNALKFSKPGTPTKIIITSRIVKGGELISEKKTSTPGQSGQDRGIGSLSPHKNYCHISVSDNGIGFEPQFSDRIFKVFQKLHSREEYAGTGIGLSIVKKIADNHEGIVIATGELDKGATFDIYIPN